MNWLDTLRDVVLPLITAIVGWFVGRKKKDNDFLADLQSSINLLSDKNTDLLKEVVQLRLENAQLMSNQATLQSQIKTLTFQNKELQTEIEQLNERLNNVKTITRTK